MRTAALLLALTACASPICAGCGGDDGGPTDGLPSSFALTAVAGTTVIDGGACPFVSAVVDDAFTMNVRKWSTAECTCAPNRSLRGDCHVAGDAIDCLAAPFDHWIIMADAATKTAEVTLTMSNEPGCSATVQTTLVQIPDV